MRSNGLRLLIAIGLLTLGAASAYAQEDKVAASVPFDFVVSGKTLPAGSYTIQRSSEDQPGTLALRNGDTLEEIFTLTGFHGRDVGEKLVFHRYGDRYFLSEVWTPRGRHQLRESREELRLARSAQPTVTALAGTH